ENGEGRSPRPKNLHHCRAAQRWLCPRIKAMIRAASFRASERSERGPESIIPNLRSLESGCREPECRGYGFRPSPLRGSAGMTGGIVVTNSVSCLRKQASSKHRRLEHALHKTTQISVYWIPALAAPDLRPAPLGR